MDFKNNTLNKKNGYDTIVCIEGKSFSEWNKKEVASDARLI